MDFELTDEQRLFRQTQPQKDRYLPPMATAGLRA
jgi:hypothetical protein